MIALILLSLALAALSGAMFKEADVDDNSGMWVIGVIVLCWAALSAAGAFLMHEDRLKSIETREKPTIDLKVTTTHDGVSDTVYVYHFEKK